MQGPDLRDHDLDEHHGPYNDVYDDPSYHDHNGGAINHDHDPAGDVHDDGPGNRDDGSREHIDRARKLLDLAARTYVNHAAGNDVDPGLLLSAVINLDQRAGDVLRAYADDWPSVREYLSVRARHDRSRLRDPVTGDRYVL